MSFRSAGDYGPVRTGDGGPRVTRYLERLPTEWAQAFEWAWRSFRDGNVGVGAVVLDGEGQVLGYGRNRTNDREARHNELVGSAVAHAEINALTNIGAGDYPDHTVVTTFQPCLMCTGALVHSHVGTVRYAAPDPLMAGVEDLPQMNAFAKRRWPTTWEGPRLDEWGVLGALLPLTYTAQHRPEGRTLKVYRKRLARTADLAVELAGSGEARSLAQRPSLDVALDKLWERLGTCTGELAKFRGAFETA